MGCSIGRQYLQPDGQITIKKQEDIRINPGIFVQENPNNFHSIYRLGSSIKRGISSEVSVCYRRDNKAKRAVKIYRKSKGDLKIKNIDSEIQILKSLDNAHIIRIHEIFQDRSKMYMVMEFCERGELFSEIVKRTNFSETDAGCIMKQVFTAVSYLHSNSITHGDLRPENILLSSQNLDIKVIGFGKTGEVSLRYSAPEVFTRDASELSDIWSCGVILYILLAGYPPFEGESEEELKENARLGILNLDSEPWPSISTEAKELIQSLICPVENRISARLALEHPWITSLACPSDSNVQSVLENLKTFTKSTKLREAVETFIVTQCVSAQDLKVYKEIFTSFDTNKDGKLSCEEIMDAFAKYEHLEDSDVHRIMKTLDSDRNGFIDYTEFIKACMDRRKLLSMSNLKAAFSMFDRDGSGSISPDELKKILQGNAFSKDHVWNEIIRDIDQNGDGEIDLHEFQDVLLTKI